MSRDWKVVDETSPVIPEWARVVRMRRTGIYALWDTRKQGRRPFVPYPAGMSHLKFRRSDVVVDIGSYIGAFSVRASRVASRVVAYDPSPAAFFVLSLNAKRFGIEAVNAAVVGKAPDGGMIELHIATAGLGLSNSCFNTPRSAEVIAIPAVEYAEACREATVVKMDAEGAEHDFPVGEVEGDDLRAVLISFHKRPNFDWRAAARARVATLARLGFKLVNRLDLDAPSGSYITEGVWLR